MHYRILTAALLLSVAGVASATDLDLNLSDDTAEIGLSQTLQSQQPDTSRVGAAVLFNDDDDVVGSGFWHVTGNLRQGYEPLKFGAGVKAYLANLDAADTTVAALGIGGLLRLEIPQTTVPLAAVVEGHIAPAITTTGQGEGVEELIGRLEARFARNATAYIGYRYLNFEVNHHRDRRVDNGFLVGLRLGF